jgi:general secretion pathway protein D
MNLLLSQHIPAARRAGAARQAVLMNRGSRGRSVFASMLALWFAANTCLVPALFASGGQEDSPKDQAKALAKKAKKAAKSNKNADAYLLYSEAAAMEPKNKKLKEKMEALQSRAALESRPLPAVRATPEPTFEPPSFAPEDTFSSFTAREYALARQPLGLPELKPTPGKQDFDINGNARTLFDQIAQRFGLETVYDGDYPPGGQALRFRISGIDYREALHDLEAMTSSFVIPLSPNLFMVAQDTPQKRNDLEQTIAISIPVPQALTIQELTEIAQAVKQATNIEKLAWDTTEGTVIMRDRISRVLPAQALFAELFAWRSEVMIEVEFLEVSDSDLLNYGFNVTTSIPAVYLGQILNNAISVPSGVTSLLSFGGGKTLIGLGVAQVEAMFNQSISSTRTLFRAQIRSVDSQPVTFHVGEKYPVITQGYFGGTTTAQQGTTFQPPPSFTFEDLGVALKVTPHVHGVDGITLAVETSYELLTGGNVNGIPIIGNRSFNNQVRLRDGEWAVVAGMTGNTDSKSASGFWGLAQLPLIGNLFKQTSKDKERQHVLIAIRPHLLSLPPDQVLTPRVRVGTETRPFTPL